MWNRPVEKEEDEDMEDEDEDEKDHAGHMNISQLADKVQLYRTRHYGRIYSSACWHLACYTPLAWC